MLAKLEEEYGKPGFISVYLELKGAFDTQILANSDPIIRLSPTLGEWLRPGLRSLSLMSYKL